MFSDTYKIKLVDDVIYEVYGRVCSISFIKCFKLIYIKFIVIIVSQLVTRKSGDVEIAGFNPSAEEADEGTDEIVESGVDVVLNHRLQETFAFGDKKSYTLYLKDYMKK